MAADAGRSSVSATVADRLLSVRPPRKGSALFFSVSSVENHALSSGLLVLLFALGWAVGDPR